jgi:hypothetical protein
MKHSLISTLALSISAQFILSCGSSGGNLQGKYSVTDVKILANDIQLGETVRTEVFFETKFELDGMPDGLDVIVRIPPELEYVPGSSFIYDNITDNADPFSPTDVRLCAGGESFFIYSFEDFDLFGRELSHPGQFGLKFESRGISKTPVTYVGAIAGRGVGFDCGVDFPAEEKEGVEVL